MNHNLSDKKLSLFFILQTQKHNHNIHIINIYVNIIHLYINIIYFCLLKIKQYAAKTSNTMSEL